MDQKQYSQVEKKFENSHSTEVCRSSIEELTLSSYRNFSNYNIATDSKPVLILGENGLGKTNILESISLLFPGKGLKNTKFEDICPRKGANIEHSWNIKAKIKNFLGIINLASSFNKNLDISKRLVHFNGSKIANTELARINSVIWLTPQMDYLFIGPTTDRRKFYDRMVYTFDPEHSSRINRYEYYVKERAAVLQTTKNPNWLSLLEEKIAEVAVAISYARLQTLHYLQNAIETFESDFPKAILSLEGDIENIALQYTAIQLEEIVKNKLFQNREEDAQSKRTQFGPHRTDLIAHHPLTKQPAYISSTGEQKALLISIILAEIYAKSCWTNNLPIVLLDEVTVHLDKVRRKSLMKHLVETRAQFWITANTIDQVPALQDICKIKLNANSIYS